MLVRRDIDTEGGALGKQNGRKGDQAGQERGRRLIEARSDALAMYMKHKSMKMKMEMQMQMEMGQGLNLNQSQNMASCPITHSRSWISNTSHASNTSYASNSWRQGNEGGEGPYEDTKGCTHQLNHLSRSRLDLCMLVPHNSALGTSRESSFSSVSDAQMDMDMRLDVDWDSTCSRANHSSVYSEHQSNHGNFNNGNSNNNNSMHLHRSRKCLDLVKLKTVSGGGDTVMSVSPCRANSAATSPCLGAHGSGVGRTPMCMNRRPVAMLSINNVSINLSLNMDASMASNTNTTDAIFMGTLTTAGYDRNHDQNQSADQPKAKRLRIV